MSLPDERTRAIINVRNFLRDLLNPFKTKRIPRAIRNEAYYLLKHYPSTCDMLDAVDNYQQVFDIDVLMEELDE